MKSCLKFKLPDAYDTHQLLDNLSTLYTIDQEATSVDSFSMYDTFDWRLFRKFQVLVKLQNSLQLKSLSTGKVLQQVEADSAPTFIWDFPDCALKKDLSPIIKMRALMELAEIRLYSTTYRVLNQDEKTVARIVIETMKNGRSADAPSVATFLWIKPVRGYAKPLEQLQNQLADMELSPAKEDEFYFKALESAGKKPGDYSAKISLQLKPEMQADDATKDILRFLLQVMHHNEAYIKTDIDTEFLHDFRVAVRRTRSALSQVKFIFPPETTERFKTDFRYIGQLSNDLRDLDVYLLNEDSYRKMIPAVLRDDIDPMFDYLQKKRVSALKKVTRGLNSKKYAQILHDWELFLNEPPTNPANAANATIPVITLARQRIYKRYKVIVRDGNRILKNTEDELLHDLRIECKKLRYLMEFFVSLFPHKKINLLIKQLKILQDNLGDFNDLCVQEDYLQDIAQQLPVSGPQSRKALLAIGSLICTIDTQRQAVKSDFAETFINFASAKNKQLFKELFASKQKETDR